MFDNVSSLLENTRSIQGFEQKLMEATGEHFNIFEVLRIGNLEVTTHSPFLAELLDPKGRHGLGSRFLGQFTKQFGLYLDPPVRVWQERWLDVKSKADSGRIDILIRDKNGNEVVIENKIYASDQENQINRYLQSRQRAKIFYLTLDGHDPGDSIPEKQKARLTCISYNRDILQWLEACRKESATAPV